LRIGITGTKEGATDAQIAQISKLFEALFSSPVPEREVHHGDCVGVDSEVHHYLRGAFGRKVKIVVHPPDNPKHRAYCAGDRTEQELPYLSRNTNIVNQSTVMIVVPRTNKEEIRSGTWSTYRKARKAMVPCFIVFPEGFWRIDG
jgi:hypothetical protein